MTKTYYAVKVGKKPGIYHSWEECEAQVKGFKGSKYKKFKSLEEAENFINDTGDFKRPDMDHIKEDEMIAYVDGSFCLKTRTYSYGAVILTKEGKETYNGRDDDPELALMRNVSGEIKGAMVAMEKALEKKKKTLYIYYDYSGIEHWAKGDWKTNKEGTKAYKQFYDSIKDRLEVVFVKVKAHSGVKYNEEADILAKEAIL